MDTLRQHSYSGALSAVESNKVLRNTYTLLAMTLTFSAVMAGISSSLNLPHPGILSPWLVILVCCFSPPNSATVVWV